jgi:hypothetical protein
MRLRTDGAPTLLQTPAVGVCPPPVEAPEQRPKFPKDEAGFLSELRRRTDDYFAKTGRS